MRRVLAGLAVVVLAGCAIAPLRDSCGRPRHFKQYSWPSRSYYALPQAAVAELPAEVRTSAGEFMREAFGDSPFEIVEARRSGEYVLLTIRPPCVDCDRWLVYSFDRRCIVGTFVLHSQG